MESNWQLGMILDPNSFIIDFHIVVNGLFIAQMIVILLLAVNQAFVRGYVFFFFLFLIILFLSSSYYLSVFVC